MTDKKKLGAMGEEIATEVLKSKGYYIIRRNFSCPYGEIDIIALKDGVLVFVEAKTRTSTFYGSPGEAVDYRKQRHIKNAARYYMSRSNAKYSKTDIHVMEVTINHVMGLDF